MFNFFKKKPTKTYFSSSEYVSAGHPDRVADNIAAEIINAIQKQDGPTSHAAIEVFLTHTQCIISGEATTTLPLTYAFLRKCVNSAFHNSGYLKEARNYWTKKELALASNLEIVNNIQAQSPDIAIATTSEGIHSGWNDQGVYFSSADNSTPARIGFSHAVADLIGNYWFNYSHYSITEGTYAHIFGPDIKVVVTTEVKEDGFTPIAITDITIAIPHTAYDDPADVREFVKEQTIIELARRSLPLAKNLRFTINGTGCYVSHGCIADTSMTGRKISVNHPSAGPVWANKMIGGGSLTKPWHASDLLLNVAARFVANVVVASELSSYAIVGISGAIGQKSLQSLFIKGDDNFDKIDANLILDFFYCNIDWSPSGIAILFGMFTDKFNFSDVVLTNYFGRHQYQPWEDRDLIECYASELRAFLKIK